jgi:hypothetical protein
VPPDKRSGFIEGVKHCLDSSSAEGIKFIIALREEFFGRLIREFEDQIPVFLNRAFHFNLLPLSKADAYEAIVRPLQKTKNNIQYHKHFVEQILLDNLAAQGSDSTGINPTHLQIVCNELFSAASQRLPQEGSVVIDEELYNDLGGAQTILNTYLDKVVNEIAGDLQRIRVVRSVLQRMIDTTGTRRFVSLELLKRELSDINEAEIVILMQKLLDRRVIEERPPNYSLSHDYLVNRVQDWFDPIAIERKRA